MALSLVEGVAHSLVEGVACQERTHGSSKLHS